MNESKMRGLSVDLPVKMIKPCEKSHGRLHGILSIMKTLSCVMLVLLLLPACTPADGFDAGRPITKDELASLSAELFTEAVEPDASDAEEPPLRDPNRVYWVKGGSVYHYDPQCPHIRHAKDIIEGTFRTAEWSYGIDKPCSACGGE